MRILLIDAFNFFIRNFTTNTVTNENGEHVGGIVGSILSLYSSIKNLEPDFVFLCYEGKNSGNRRRKSFHDYKSGRRSPHTISNTDNINPKNDFWKEILIFQDLIALLPICTLSVDNLEADDIISYICSNFKDDEKIIISTDQDYYQLIDNKTIIFNPVKKQLIDKVYIKEKFNVEPKNHLIAKCILGDKSDNIPKIPKLGIKKINKLFPELSTQVFESLESFLDFYKNSETQNKILKENLEILRSNYKVMNLLNLNLSPISVNRLVNQIINWKSETDLVNFRLLIQKNFINMEIPFSSFTFTFRRLDYESQKFIKHIREVWSRFSRLVD